MFRITFCLFIFFCYVQSLTAQEIFDYEHRIPNEENYTATEIGFSVPHKKTDINLSGTLLQPKEAFDKIIIIVPGSSPDTRHSHYLLTEAFLKNNIAVYRYDERGLGKSGGNYNKANYSITDMGSELAACFTVLKAQYAGKSIGFLGHSQGGMVTMEAFTNSATPDFLVQWAAPAQKHGAFLKYQL